MELTKEDSVCMIDVLRTLIYNNVSDLKTKLVNAKETLNPEIYKIMIFGDQDLFPLDSVVKNKKEYRCISSLDGRWCLQSQLFYHLTKTKKITEDEYYELIKL